MSSLLGAEKVEVKSHHKVLIDISEHLYNKDIVERLAAELLKNIRPYGDVFIARYKSENPNAPWPDIGLEVMRKWCKSSMESTTGKILLDTLLLKCQINASTLGEQIMADLTGRDLERQTTSADLKNITSLTVGQSPTLIDEDHLLKRGARLFWDIGKALGREDVIPLATILLEGVGNGGLSFIKSLEAPGGAPKSPSELIQETLEKWCKEKPEDCYGSTLHKALLDVDKSVAEKFGPKIFQAISQT